jgi:lysophospholipase L1-like esterase
MILVAVSLALFGVLALPGVSQAAGRAKAHGESKAPKANKVEPYYLALGDSWSMGFQPEDNGDSPIGVGSTGYTGYLAKKAHLQQENFACAGATSTSILTFVGCSSPFGPAANIDGVTYPTTTQEQAAVNFIAAHHGQVGLVTISIGGNDLRACVSSADPQTCVLDNALPTIQTNLTILVADINSALTSAGDTGAQVIGLTTLDTVLGQYVNSSPGGGAGLAALSVVAFNLFNPMLQGIYTARPNGSFVNVTTAPYKTATEGMNTPSTVTKKVNPYGVIPANVAELCALTYVCIGTNFATNGHPNNKGYSFYGKLIVADYRAH